MEVVQEARALAELSHLLEMRNISKRFGRTQALKSAALTADRGEIVALLGENSADNSTLIKIMVGVVSLDGGTISYGGRDFTHSPRQMPVAFIHQDLGLIGVSTDFEEVVNLCHRALVFDRGKVVAELDDEQLSVGSLLAATSSCLGHSDALAASQW